MRKLKMLILSLILILAPTIGFCATGHINGCTNTTFDTNCCTKTFKITAQSGYTVTDVIVNGVSQGAISSYTFSNITGPQTLKVITTANGGSTSGSTGGSTGGTAVSGGPFTIRFNANGGTGTMANQTYAAGVEQTLPANTFTKAGYSFGGWAVIAGGEKIYTNGDIFVATQNQTLYAVWEKDCWIFCGGSDDEVTYTGVNTGLTFKKMSDSISVTASDASEIYFYLDGILVASDVVGDDETTSVTYAYTVFSDLWFSHDRYVADLYCDDDHREGYECDGECCTSYGIKVYCNSSQGSGTTKVDIVNSSANPLYVYNKGM